MQALRDCPLCRSLRSVDDDGYCNACGKMVPPGRMLAARWEHGLPRSVSAVERCRAAPPALSGRWNAGRRPRCKVSSLDVLRMRQWQTDHPTQSVRAIARILAPQYPLSESAIREILQRRTWITLPDEPLTERHE